MKTIQQIIAETDEIRAQEMEEKLRGEEVASLFWLLKQIPVWTRWYLKRNQQRNYFRVTRIIPPGFEGQPTVWIQRFQVWIKGKIYEDYLIEPETFDHFFKCPGWERRDDPEMTYALLRPKAPLAAQRPFPNPPTTPPSSL